RALRLRRDGEGDRLDLALAFACPIAAAIGFAFFSLLAGSEHLMVRPRRARRLAANPAPREPRTKHRHLRFGALSFGACRSRSEQGHSGSIPPAASTSSCQEAPA